MKPRWYFCPTWRQNFYFFIGWKPEAFEKYVLKTYDHKFKIGREDGKTLGIEHHDGSRFLIWSRKRDASVVAHESVHAVNWMLAERGYRFDPDNDEPQAYLVGALVREALTK